MGGLWIVLTKRWDLATMQASLNVIISILGTVGLWAFSRYWWRRASGKVLREKSSIPLSTLLTIQGPGDGWDVVTILKRKIFARANWHIFVQLIMVVSVSIACAFAGPIAKASLRNGISIEGKTLQVLNAVKGGGGFGNLLYASVLWNNTAQSLIDANFPDNQLMDYLPPTITPPWTYVADEWDPTWAVVCNYTEEQVLHNLTGTGNATMYDPINAFPAYRDTYDPSWLVEPEYRIAADFANWDNWTDPIQITEVLFFIIAQSNPEIDDRMYDNNGTLRISISVLHARRFRVLYESSNSMIGQLTWRPIGPVENASYSRAECEITRTPRIADPDQIPWPWSNETSSLLEAFRTYYFLSIESLASKRLTVTIPGPREVFRFYQVYTASVSTFQSSTFLRTVSTKVGTVELSVIFLAALIAFSVSIIYSSIRYCWFLRRYSAKIKELYVPDSKVEWMLHAVKASEFEVDVEEGNGDGAGGRGRRRRKESEQLCSATFGQVRPEPGWDTDPGITVPKLARVMSSEGSSIYDLRQGSVSFPNSGRLPSLSETVSCVNKRDYSPSLALSSASSCRTRVGDEPSPGPHFHAPRWRSSEDTNAKPAPPGPTAQGGDESSQFLSVWTRSSSSYGRRSSSGDRRSLSTSSCGEEAGTGTGTGTVTATAPPKIEVSNASDRREGEDDASSKDRGNEVTDGARVAAS